MGIDGENHEYIPPRPTTKKVQSHSLVSGSSFEEIPDTDYTESVGIHIGNGAPSFLDSSSDDDDLTDSEEEFGPMMTTANIMDSFELQQRRSRMLDNIEVVFDDSEISEISYNNENNESNDSSNSLNFRFGQLSSNINDDDLFYTGHDDDDDNNSIFSLDSDNNQEDSSIEIHHDDEDNDDEEDNSQYFQSIGSSLSYQEQYSDQEEVEDVDEDDSSLISNHLYSNSNSVSIEFNNYSENEQSNQESYQNQEDTSSEMDID